MADLKISQLSAITTLVGTEELVVADTGTTKKITAANALGAWQSYTPVLTASTTNPTLGTGGVILGRYCKIGGTVFFRVKILFGSTMTGGSGTYRVTHPSPVPDENAWTVPIIGQVTIFDSSPATFRIGTIQFGGAGTGYFVMQVDSATTNVSNSSPITFAASDQILIVGMYEVD
jgi:hypothetical protein